MKVVVAGATGYLGQKLLDKLINEKHVVMVIVRVPNQYLLELQRDGLIKICICYTENFELEIIQFQPDVLFSTTCCYETESNFLEKTIDANYVFPSLLLRIISHLSEKKCVRFISIGTSLPPSLNLYSLTKYQFNEIGRFFANINKVHFVNVLLESFYGEDEPSNRFITRTIDKLRLDQDVLLTEGLQKRDFIYVGDVVDILEYFTVAAIDFSSKSNFITVPVGSGFAPTIRELLLFLKLEMGSSSELKFGAIPLRKNEPSTVAELSILRQLGYTKNIFPWKDGMKKMIGKNI